MINNGHLAAVLILWPFIIGALSFLLKRKEARALTIIGSIVSVVLAIGLCASITQTGQAVYSLGSWPKPIGIHLHIDGLSSLMTIVTAILGCFLNFYSLKYFADKKKTESYFRPLCFFCFGGLNVLFLSNDLFNIYVALEIISFSAISLVALSGNSRAIIASTQYFFVTLIGSLLYLLGVVFIYGTYNVLDFGILSSIVQPGGATASAITLMTIGLIIKGALFPMHFWLPPAHANAPAPVSAILSGLVVMGAFYLLVRLWFDVFVQSIGWHAGQVLGILGSIAILGGAIMAYLSPVPFSR